MPDILRGFTYDTRVARYRDMTTGRFVPRSRGENSIMRLLERHVSSAEQRMGNIVQGIAAGEIAPGVGQVMLRDELRRLSLSNSALAKGGWDRLTPADYGRAGRQLRDTYARVSNLVTDLRDGNASVAQAMNRIQGYAGEARQLFFVAEREAMRTTGQRMEARRTLNPAEHCADCLALAALGWQPMEQVPVPGDGSTRCGTHDRCSIEYRVAVDELATERIAA